MNDERLQHIKKEYQRVGEVTLERYRDELLGHISLMEIERDEAQIRFGAAEARIDALTAEIAAVGEAHGWALAAIEKVEADAVAAEARALAAETALKREVALAWNDGFGCDPGDPGGFEYANRTLAQPKEPTP